MTSCISLTIFEGGTIQNNIIRVALTDPAIVVVLDGIWETLINKGHYLAYAERKGIDGEAGYSRAPISPRFFGRASCHFRRPPMPRGNAD